MRKIWLLGSLLLLMSSCSMLSELSALTKCEFRLHSYAEPSLGGIDISQKRSWSDLSLMEGQALARNLLSSSLPFDIQVNVEARNPGTSKAAVNSIRWIAMVDKVKIAQGTLNHRVEIDPSGGRAMIPIHLHADLFDYLEGDSPRSMLNFALNLINAGDEATRLSLKIKPSVMIGTRTVYYPGYFTISREFRSGN